MSRPGEETTLGELDWPALVRTGDLVVWGQSCAEPVGLVAALLEARAAIGTFKAFIGISHSPNIDPKYADCVAFSSYCGTGNNRLLGEKLDVLPLHYSQLAATLGRENPVLLLSLAQAPNSNYFSFGAGADYLSDLIPQARLIIAEVSDTTICTEPSAVLRRDQVDLIVHTSVRPAAAEASRPGDNERAVAGRVAGLIDAGATLQIGLGAVPAAVLRALGGHRDLGIHSGLITDEVAELAECGVINNERKTIDRGITVTGLLSGGANLMRWAHRNRALSLRPTSYTHDHAVLRSIEQFVAINSAVEVDLTGQINAETARGHYVGAVGGAGAFLRGALESRGGLPIIALPATAGRNSRIVANLSGPVSTARADAGIIVTEHGVADLRGLSVRARRDKMLAIADPAHRAALESAIST
jgi:acyl-CoA hydrolase